MEHLFTSVKILDSQFREYFSYQIGANTLWDLMLAVGFFIVLLIVFKIFEKIVVSRLRRLAKTTKNEFDDELIEVIESISPLFYFVVALYFPLKGIVLPETADKILDGVFIVVIVWQVIRFILSLIDFGLRRFVNKKEASGVKTTYHGVRLVAKIILWIVGLLLILSNLGFNITSLVASLGIGGIAVALALQNILTDIFSSFSIYFDKPFQVGDYIVVGKDDGIVKKIGLKTTRLETLQGEELVISNQELTSSRVQNFRKIKKRRNTIKLGVVYETSQKKLKRVGEILEKIVTGTKDVDFVRCFFTEFGDFSLNFELIYYTLSPEYVDFLVKQEEINFAIKEAFEKEKIEFAYPTQVIYKR